MRALGYAAASGCPGSSASASLSLPQQAYAVGDATYVQVLDAQRLHQQAKLGEEQADCERYVDAVKLLLATGGSIDPAVKGD